MDKGRSSRHLRWSGVVGVVISLALLWWALHDVSPSDAWREIRGMRWAPFLATLVLATLPFPLRTIRWRYLLRAEGAALPFVPLWHATAIGFMANNLLPARAGEFARAYAARRLTGVRFSTAFASIAVERVMDGLALVALLAVAIWAGGFDAATAVGGQTLGGVARGAAVLFLGLLVAAFVLVHWPGPALSAIRATGGALLPRRWVERLLGVLEGMLSGLDALRSPSRFAIVTFWSFVIWIVAASSFWAAFQAFHIEVPWSAALMVQGLVSFGVAIPSAPGFAGVFEGVI
ncbi:MAG: lysylphosphatidylglycerol synthase transmembrane domain-containing protein, partial [Gemmatimonadales bacterium]